MSTLSHIQNEISSMISELPGRDIGVGVSLPVIYGVAFFSTLALQRATNERFQLDDIVPDFAKNFFHTIEQYTAKPLINGIGEVSKLVTDKTDFVKRIISRGAHLSTAFNSIFWTN